MARSRLRALIWSAGKIQSIENGLGRAPCGRQRLRAAPTIEAPKAALAAVNEACRKPLQFNA
jgi:hypothetical protein